MNHETDEPPDSLIVGVAPEPNGPDQNPDPAGDEEDLLRRVKGLKLLLDPGGTRCDLLRRRFLAPGQDFEERQCSRVRRQVRLNPRDCDIVGSLVLAIVSQLIDRPYR